MSEKLTEEDSVKRLAHDVITCERCKRLRKYCLGIALEKKKAHRDETYWGKPVPDFGDPKARVLIVGLAPAAHGANRTGRMFTGDRSGQWLYRALHRAGFANQSTYERADDGLKLVNCVIAATVRCAPPGNKPLPSEIEACSEYLDRSFFLYRPHVVVALGGIGWRATFDHLRRKGRWTKALPKFAHGVETKIDSSTIALGTYHPSQQNTFTGRLTEPMLDRIFSRARELARDLDKT